MQSKLQSPNETQAVRVSGLKAAVSSFNYQNVARNSSSHLFKQLTTTSKDHSEDSSSELLFLEDYHAELDDEFLKEELKPYLLGVFSDFALRSTAPTNGCLPGKSIDKVTFTEYTNLPGIISDRFFVLAKRNRSDNRIGEDDFLHTISTVFMSNLE
jgi:hypothetical protein